jgi:type IV pilus assembly protein PilC
MSSQTDNKKLKVVLQEVYKKIQRGVSVSESFREHEKRFPELFISMLEAGEASGNLDISLERMGIALTKEHKLNQKIKSAMVYPIVLSIVAVLVVIFLLIAVVPTFAGMYAGSGQELPGLTKMMLGLGSFMSRHFILIFLVVITIVFVIRIILRSEEIRYAFDRNKLKIPVMGKLLTKIITARFTQSMSTLLVSGIPLPQAVDITSRSLGNAYVSSHVRAMNSEIRSGRGLYMPLKEIGIFPQMVIQMVQLGEASGTLDELLSKTAAFYEDEAEAATTRLASLIEPLIIVVMGGLILVIVLSILLPMFGMFSLVA